MNAVAIRLIVFACVFGAALFGMFLRTVLPEQHLSADSKQRWLMFEERSNSVSIPLLAVLVFWLAIVFASFGLFAPPNATVIATLLLYALAVSGAIFLAFEMYTPFKGALQRSAAQRSRASGRVAAIAWPT